MGPPMSSMEGPTMLIKSLIENVTENPTLEAEHGLSLYIETKDHKILFDVGQSDAFLRNAYKLGVDIEGVEVLVISHGHYDHGGGLKAFLKANDKAKVYVAKEAFEHHLSKRQDGRMKEIGLDPSLKKHPRIYETKGNEQLCDCLELMRNTSHSYPKPTMNRYLYKKVHGVYVKDDFYHEQNLMVHCDGKTVLIVGCAHNGILNILDTYKTRTNADPNVVVGGFHLSSGSRNEKESQATFDQVSHVLGQKETEYYTCHCTGMDGYDLLKKDLGEQITYLSAGKSIHL